MSEATTRRLTGAAGIGFVALFVVAYLLAGSLPTDDSSGQAILSYVSGNHTRVLASMYVLGLALAIGLCFLTGLRRLLVPADSGLEVLGTLGLVGRRRLDHPDVRRGSLPAGAGLSARRGGPCRRTPALGRVRSGGRCHGLRDGGQRRAVRRADPRHGPAPALARLGRTGRSGSASGGRRVVHAQWPALTGRHGGLYRSGAVFPLDAGGQRAAGPTGRAAGAGRAGGLGRLLSRPLHSYRCRRARRQPGRVLTRS